MKLSTANLATSYDFDLSDLRCVDWEGTLYTYARGNLTDGECFVYARTTLCDYDTLIDLYALFTTFDNTAVYLDGVANIKRGHIAFQLLIIDFVENVHLNLFLSYSKISLLSSIEHVRGALVYTNLTLLAMQICKKMYFLFSA